MPEIKNNLKKKTAALVGILLVLATTIFVAAEFAKKNKGDTAETKRPSATSKQKVTRNPNLNNKGYATLIEDGDKLKEENDLGNALSSYQKAAEIDPTQFTPYERIGDIFYVQKKYEEARKNFQFAAAMNMEMDRLKIKTVQSYLAERKVVEAKIELEKITPPSQDSTYYLGLISAFLNDRETAEKSLRESLALGENETIKTNAQKVIDDFQIYSATSDAKIEYLQTMLAQTFDQIGEFGLAIELSFDAIKSEHNYRDAWIVLGHAFLNENKLADAEDALTKATEIDSTHGTAFFFLGLAKKKLNKMEEAADALEKAMNAGWKPQVLVKNELAEIYTNLADSALAGGKSEEAKVYFEKSARIGGKIKKPDLNLNSVIGLPGNAPQTKLNFIPSLSLK